MVITVLRDCGETPEPRGHVAPRKQTRRPSQLLSNLNCGRGWTFRAIETKHPYPAHDLTQVRVLYTFAKMNQRTRQSPESPDPPDEELDAEIASIRAKSKQYHQHTNEQAH